MDIRLDVNEPTRMIWLRILLSVLSAGFLYGRFVLLGIHVEVEQLFR